MRHLYEGLIAFLKINFSYFLLFFIISIFCKVIFPYCFKSLWQTDKIFSTNVYISEFDIKNRYKWQKLRNSESILKSILSIISLMFFIYLLSFIEISTIKTYKRAYFFHFWISLLSVRAFIRILHETELKNYDTSIEKFKWDNSLSESDKNFENRNIFGIWIFNNCTKNIMVLPIYLSFAFLVYPNLYIRIMNLIN
jgi:hypothetical protein